MKKERKAHQFVRKPIYPGGPKALEAFVTANLTYPEEAAAEKVEGTVRVRYTIDYKGKVIETSIVSKLGAGCDEEAARVVSLFKFKVPPVKGTKVHFHKSINIHFRLPKEKKKPLQQLNYHLSQKKKEVKKPENKDKGAGFNYSIKI